MPRRCSISIRAACSRPRGACATPANCRPAAKSPAARDFFLGGADNPIDPPPGWKPTGLEGKAAAGAQFVQTQFCMDAGVVRRYMARLAEHGLADKLSFLIGIVPLRSAKSARWIKEKLFGAVIPDAIVDRMDRATDPAAEGRRICIDVVRELAEIPHVAGVHIMAPGQRRRGARCHQGGARQHLPPRARLIVQLSADFTRSGENGTRRMRTPVASKMALAIAAATGRIDGSPAPVGAMSG